MDTQYCETIRRLYQNSGGDFTRLFQTVLAAADVVGWDVAWSCLEQCIIAKRLAWLDRNGENLERTGEPLVDAYRAFYTLYLGVSVPEDGEIVEATPTRLTIRWWNGCPTLDACIKLNLDTRVVCRQVYHQPVQAFLFRLDPRLGFARNYDALRPRTPYCEETIFLAQAAKPMGST